MLHQDLNMNKMNTLEISRTFLQPVSHGEKGGKLQNPVKIVLIFFFPL